MTVYCPLSLWERVRVRALGNVAEPPRHFAAQNATPPKEGNTARTFFADKAFCLTESLRKESVRIGEIKYPPLPFYLY